MKWAIKTREKFVNVKKALTILYSFLKKIIVCNWPKKMIKTKRKIQFHTFIEFVSKFTFG